LSQTVTPSRTPSPLERDVLYGRPLNVSHRIFSAQHKRRVLNTGVMWNRICRSRVQSSLRSDFLGRVRHQRPLESANSKECRVVVVYSWTHARTWLFKFVEEPRFGKQVAWSTITFWSYLTTWSVLETPCTFKKFHRSISERSLYV